MDTRMRFRQARTLIRTKHYHEARALLEHTPHPLAKNWLAKLERIAPAGHPWYVIWKKILEQPSTESFVAILDEPNKSPWRSANFSTDHTIDCAIIRPVTSK